MSEISSLHAAGFSLVPLGGGADGKAPLAKYRGRERLPLQTIHRLMSKKESQIYGIRLHRLVIVDCDTDNLETRQYVQNRFGSSNFQVKTPRGRHYYFRTKAPAKPFTIREPMVSIDIKTGPNQYVAGPGSIRPDNSVYEVEIGHVQDLKKTPFFRDKHPKRIDPVSKKVPVGQRYTKFLSPKAIEYCPLVNSEDELFDELRAAVNWYCLEPDSVTNAEIRNCANWAWQKRLDNNLWAGAHSAVQTTNIEFKALSQVKDGELGHFLLHVLRHNFAGKNHCGQPFPIARQAMTGADVIPGWSENRYRRAADALLKAGLITMVKRGGLNAGAHLYQLSSISNQQDDTKGEGFILLSGYQPPRENGAENV